MASALEDALVCAVCLDLFQEPVSLPCGHSFCQACIRRHWNSSGDCRCPQCRRAIPDPLALRRNLSLAEVAEQLRARARPSVPLCDACPATPARPPAALSCTLCLLALCEDHARRHHDNPAFRGHRLLPTPNPGQGSPQTRWAKPDQNRSPNQVQEALKATKEGILERQRGIERLDAATESLRASLAQERMECEQTLAQLAESLAQLSGQAAELFRRAEEESVSRSAEIRQHLERELSELRKRENSWSQLALRESTGEEALEAQTPAAPLPSEPSHYDLTTLSFGDLRAMLTALHRRLEEVCTQELQRAWRPVTVFAFNPMKTKLQGLDSVSKYATSIQLDPETAHPCLIVSEDRRGVQACTRRQPLPQGPQRFNRVYFVLGCTAFSSGRHYWEVEVGSKKLWRVGLFRSSAPRNGVIPDEAFWLLEGDRDILSVKGKRDARVLSTHMPRTVGVFLDWDGGILSFYDAERGATPLCTLTDSFSEELYPVFSPGLKNDGQLLLC
ncbi:E3 ubiquitin-protein ligase TRIM11-like isoform X2 [Lepisosteus oculatus]|uniref:E3 ubiquitin-protein ligase TRIM11-like isoform X2 n=1 Tax=Lepisosteus oculatus TaxID=7918 RepID=UPI0037106C09